MVFFFKCLRPLLDVHFLDEDQELYNSMSFHLFTREITEEVVEN